MHYYTLLLLLSFTLAHKLMRFIMAFSYNSPLPHCPSPLWLVPSHPPNPRFHSMSPPIIYVYVFCSHWFFNWSHNFLSEKPLLVNSPSSLIFLSVLETVSPCSSGLSCSSWQSSCLRLPSAGITEENLRSQLCNHLKVRKREEGNKDGQKVFIRLFPGWERWLHALRTKSCERQHWYTFLCARQTPGFGLAIKWWK